MAFERSYAQAYLGAAPTGHDVDRFLESAREVERAIASNPRLKAFFMSPVVPLPAKKRALGELVRAAGVDAYGARFLDVALEKRRLPALAQILSAIREEADRARGVVAASVRVASAVDEAERAKIAQALARVVGRQVRLDVAVDEKLLGGFVAKVGSEVFDASVRHAVERFRERTQEGTET
jgi:F-type H+-transporting ATPase subunit delta